nr:ribonuclease H-like domain-containing protein [Tanacetum cinerariifolium]
MSQFVQISHTHQYVVPFHTKKFFTTLRVHSPSFSGRIVPLFDTMLIQQGEGSGTPIEPHHTPSPESRGGLPTDSGFMADQDRATIAKSSTLPRDSAPKVTSPAAEEGTTVLAGEANVPTGSGFIPTAAPTATIVSTDSEKKKLQEQIDAQVARELEEQQEREDMRMNEQIARDVEVARIHAGEEIHGMINSLDKTNETVAKYLQEYQQFASDLSLEKIELISDLVKYQEHYKKKILILVFNTSSDLSLSLGGSLYLHPNDIGGSSILTAKLNGTENYKMWSISIKFALRNHNNLGFIDGTCKRDDKHVAFAN